MSLFHRTKGKDRKKCKPIHRLGCNGIINIFTTNCIISMKPLALVPLLLIPVLALATEAKWECGERSNLPIEGKNYCAAGDFRQSEINLKKVLNTVLKKQQMAFGDSSALVDAQKSFESYRDKQCEAENKRLEAKPFHPMIVAQCKTRLTNVRIKELESMQQQGQ